MMPRKLFYIPVFLVVLVVVVPLFINFSDYAEPYIIDAQKTIGRTIKTGAIRLQILPTPRIKIHDVVLGNALDSSKPEMVTVKSAEVILSLFDLLRGKIVIKSVSLNTPEISLEKNKAGNGNWDLKITPSEKEAKQPSATSTNAAAAGLVVKHFDIYNATVHYVDHKEGTAKSFSNLNIECASEDLMGPYKVHIRADSGTDRIDIEMITGILNFDKSTSFEADVNLNHQEQKVHLILGGSLDITKRQFKGQFKASSVDYPLTLELPHQKIDLRKTIDAQGEILATSEHITVKNLSISHPVGQLVGLLNYSLSTQLFETDLKFKHHEDIVSIQCFTNDFAEFEYHISSARYLEILKWFTPDQFLKGTLDLKGIFKSEGTRLTFKKTTIQFGDLRADANIQFDTETKQTVVNAQTQNIQQWGRFFGHDLPFSGPTTVALKVTPVQQENLETSAKISIGKGNIIFDGSLGTKNLTAKGNLSVEHINFSDYNIDCKSGILAKPTEIDLNIQSIEIKDKSGLDVAAGGKVLIDLSKSVPHIVGTITAHPIQLTAYTRDAPIYLMPTLYMPELFKYQLMQIAANTNSRWSSALIKLPLQAFTMSLQVNVPKVTLGGLIFEALQSEISLSAGKLAVPFSARMYGGKLNGALLIETAKNQSINLSAKFDGISIEKIQAAAAHFRQGKVFGQIELKTTGNSQHDWVSKLQGQAQFGVKDGIVKGFDLNQIVNMLKKPKHLLDPKTLQSGFSGKGETAFSNGSGKFTIVNGVASTNDLIIEAPDAKMKAEGQADLLNWQMRFTGEVSSPALKDLPPIKFIIKGPLDQPSYNLDLKQLQQLLLQKGAEDLISKSLGKSIPGLDKIIPGINKKSKKAEQNGAPEASNANDQEEDKPVKPEKVVKNILKGLFG